MDNADSDRRIALRLGAMMHIYEVVAEPVRRRIIEVLAVGEHPAGMLHDIVMHEFSITRSAVSHHLRILRDQDVVIVAPWETMRLYRLNPRFLERLDDTVAELFELWDQRYGTRYQRSPEYPDEPSRPRAMPRAMHRAGRKGLRGAGVAEDPWVQQVSGPPRTD